MASKDASSGSKNSHDSLPKISTELEWIRFREETLGPAAYQEAAGPKLMRKMKENPFVPIGAFATLGALSYGLWCFRQGRGRDSQMMMRARIAAQGFTVVAILMGFAMGATKKDGGNIHVQPHPVTPDTAKS